MARADMAEASGTADGGRGDGKHGQGGRPGAGRGPSRGERPGSRPRGGPAWRAGMWRRGRLLAAVALMLALALALHARIPNAVGNLGSLWETFLPWGGLLVPVLLVLALLRRSATALVALLAPTVMWAGLFGGQLTAKSGDGGDLTVASHNVGADNPDPGGTARELTGSGADIIALQEVAPERAGAYEKALSGTYGYHERVGTVGVWSKFPLRDTRTVDIGMGWPRAMRTTAATPSGPVAVYAAHMPSVRVEFRSGFTAGKRDDSATALGEAIAADSTERVVLLGDLNGTMNDRALAPVTAHMRSTQGAAGDGMGLSWPASFPMARIDQIMVRGMEPVSSWNLPATASDHLPVAASVDL